MSKQETTTATTSRLAAYSAVAAATTVTGGVANAADVVWDIEDVTVKETEQTTIFNMVSGNVTVDTSADVYDTPSAFGVRAFIYDGNDRGFMSMGFSFSATNNPGAVGQPSALGSTYPGVDVLAGGAISGGQNFENYYGIFLGNGSQSGWGFAEGQTGFIGLKFEIGGDEHFGWAQLTRDATSDDYILHGFGYNDTIGAAAQTADTVDPIPEPSSLALLAMGAAGLAARRKRKDVA